jgi:flagellar basal-body rod protein FlgC
MSVMDISASGMSAQRIRLSVLANNIANASTTRTPEGGPYRPRHVLFKSISGEKEPGRFAETLEGVRKQIGQGVKVTSVIEDESEKAFIRVYDPAHPDADAGGYVLRPNINPALSMVDVIDATRAFEANVAAVNALKQMSENSLQIGRG